ncbi:MAG: hypothetical protein HYY17_01225 [Planctomycetes bacterium]|nr:hypothetical protein [Planctomycetota bacterium]
MAKILVALLVGGFSDAEISEFRASLLKEADPRVRVFVARTFMMDEVDETPCAITDEEERLRMRLAGHAVPGFNAKGYRFFWDCVFYEIRWKMRESFPWAECEGWFFEKYPQYYATKTTGEVRLYNECFAHQLTQPWVREELLAPFRHITPSDGKSALFNILIYRSDAKVPDDMRQICMDMALNVTEDVGNRWECIRRLRNSDIKDPALFFRNVLILEMSQAAPCHRLACKILAGILKEKPRELFENPRTRSLVATVVGALARSEQDYDHAALGEVAVTLLDADPSNREILEGVASSLGVEAAQRIRAEIEKYRTRPQR